MAKKINVGPEKKSLSPNPYENPLFAKNGVQIGQILPLWAHLYFTPGYRGLPPCTLSQHGVISLYLSGISPTHFASFPHPFTSFPQQICFISPTNCFVSPTNCCISPTSFSFPQCNVVSLSQKIKSSKFRHLLIKIRTFAHHILEI